MVRQPRWIDHHHHQQKNRELDTKPYRIHNHCRKRYDHPGEINFSKEGTLLDESESCARKRFGEKCPQNYSRQIKQNGWQTICWKTDSFFKDQQVNHQDDKGLENDPPGSQQCLLMVNEEIASDDPEQKVAISPKLAQLPTEPERLRPDLPFPVFFGLCYFIQRKCFYPLLII